MNSKIPVKVRVFLQAFYSEFGNLRFRKEFSAHIKLTHFKYENQRENVEE